MEERKDKNFEFTLYLNDHIIVQRLFNVFGFNNRAVNSLDFKYAVDDNIGIIKRALKHKTLKFMDINYNKYLENPAYDQNDNKDVFKLLIKMNGKNIAHREFDATLYPSSVRYSVDIRDNIYAIITNIQKTLSTKSEYLELKYLQHKIG